MKVGCPKFFWLAFFLFLSCKEEPINITCADPLGTDTDTLTDKQATCFQSAFNNCVWFRLEFSPPELRSVTLSTGKDVAFIFDVGEVSCLAEVTAKPTSGGVYSTVAKLHHGYVIMLQDGTFGRLFIDSWETSGNLVTEVNITRQYAY